MAAPIWRGHPVVCGDWERCPGWFGIGLRRPDLTLCNGRYFLGTPCWSLCRTAYNVYYVNLQKLDYLIRSSELQSSLKSAGIERRGSYHPNTWEPFDTVKSAKDNAGPASVGVMTPYWYVAIIKRLAPPPTGELTSQNAAHPRVPKGISR